MLATIRTKSKPRRMTTKPFFDMFNITVDGLPRVAFLASRDIVAGEELLWDYGADARYSPAWMKSSVGRKRTTSVGRKRTTKRSGAKEASSTSKEGAKEVSSRDIVAGEELGLELSFFPVKAGGWSPSGPSKRGSSSVSMQGSSSPQRRAAGGRPASRPKPGATSSFLNHITKSCGEFL